MEHNDLHLWFFGLLIECPMSFAQKGCPFNELRELPISEKMDFAQSIPEEKLDDLLLHHKECLKNRES